MKTSFDECKRAKPLRDKLWLSRGGPKFFKALESCDTRVRLQPPATKTQMAQLRRFAGGSLPDSLEAFLQNSNGLYFDCDAIVHPVSEILRWTEQLQQLDHFMPLDCFLFVGSLGSGDMFAFGKTKDGKWHSDVFWWEHETDSRYACGDNIWGYVAAHVSWRHFCMS